MSKELIRLQDLTMEFDGERILDGINLYFNDHEFLTLLGPSGCGKTTTLRIIGGFLTPTSGTVTFDGKVINDVPPYKRQINTVFQRYALFPHLDVYDNVAFGLKVAKLPKDEVDRRVNEMLEIVSLKGYENRSVDSLSGGQQQRVAIARALVNQPKVLLLDEPLAALDLRLRKDMQIELKRIQQTTGITFIYVTHDQEEAINMSDRIAVMRGGRFEQLGTPEEIYDEPKTHYVAQFIGRSTILSGKVEAVGKDTAVIRGACGSFTADASRARLSAGEDCEICVRTERMRVSPVPVEGFQLPVTVREARYAGGSVLTYAILPDGEEAVATSEGRLSDALTPGSTAYLYWNPAQAAVIGGTSHGA